MIIKLNYNCKRDVAIFSWSLVEKIISELICLSIVSSYLNWTDWLCRFRILMFKYLFPFFFTIIFMTLERIFFFFKQSYMHENMTILLWHWKNNYFRILEKILTQEQKTSRSIAMVLDQDAFHQVYTRNIIICPGQS